MQIRPYTDQDFASLRRIHAAQGFSYPFPDLTNPLFMTKLILLDESSGREVPGAPSLPPGAQPDSSASCAPTENIVGGALLRLTAEAYLFLDPHAGTPRQRWQWLLHLHATTEHEAARRGLEDVHAWLPPPIATKFGKRLVQLGWRRDDTWTPYCKRFQVP
jgi:hypothetical protein